MTKHPDDLMSQIDIVRAALLAANEDIYGDDGNADALTALESIQAMLVAGRERLHIQIREARRQGKTLREIAKASDMSYETVRRICS